MLMTIPEEAHGSSLSIIFVICSTHFDLVGGFGLAGLAMNSMRVHQLIHSVVGTTISSFFHAGLWQKRQRMGQDLARRTGL